MMEPTQRASYKAVEALAPQIRDTGDAIEAERCLPPTVVRAMKEAGVFRLAIPRAYGGLELDPLTQVRVVEELSRMDGSVGWCAMIGVAGGYASAFLHAGVPLGIARSALDAVVELSAHKEMMPARRLLREEGQVQEAVARAEATLGAARSYTYSTLEEIWQTLCRGEVLSPRQRSLFRLMIVYVHRVAKEVIATMYDTAATSAIFQTHPLDRHMRDILAACQHRVVHAKMYRPAGRLLLGLDPGDPFF